MRVIYTKGPYRIVERSDSNFDIDDLKGDCFDPRVNLGINEEDLAKQERDFESFVSRHGVYGYELEVWNPEIGQGWEHIDSCWGFIGQYSETDETFKHYIIDEMKQTVAERSAEP